MVQSWVRQTAFSWRRKRSLWWKFEQNKSQWSGLWEEMSTSPSSTTVLLSMIPLAATVWMKWAALSANTHTHSHTRPVVEENTTARQDDMFCKSSEANHYLGRPQRRSAPSQTQSDRTTAVCHPDATNTPWRPSPQHQFPGPPGGSWGFHEL